NPKTAHDGHACRCAIANRTIEVRQHAVAELEVLPANRLDLSVMKLVRIRNRSAIIVANLNWTGIACVPSPGQPQLPCASVTPKQRAEGAELKPPQIELCCELLRWDEPTDVRAPVGNAA